MDRNYDILGIPKTASADEIKKAYKKLVFQCHPDRNPGDNEQVRKFREITEAYAVISSQFGRKVGRQLNNKPVKTSYNPKKETPANPYFNLRAEKERLVSKLRDQQAIEELLISNCYEELTSGVAMLGVGAGWGYCSSDSYKWGNDLAGSIFLAAALILGAAGIGLTMNSLREKKKHKEKKDELETLIRTFSR